MVQSIRDRKKNGYVTRLRWRPASAVGSVQSARLRRGHRTGNMHMYLDTYVGS